MPSVKLIEKDVESLGTTEQEIIAKKKIKKEFNKLAKTLIGYTVTPYIVIITYVIVECTKILIKNYNNKQVADQLFNNLLLYITNSTIPIIVGTMMGFIFILVYRKKQFFTYDLVHINHKMNIKSFFLLLICFMAPQFIFGITSNITEKVFNSFGYSILGEINSATGGSQLLSMLLYSILIAPILEEFVYRGAVLRSLEKYGKCFAIVISAVLFGVMHANLIQTPFAILIGLVLGYVTVEYSIKWSILMHIMNNAMPEFFSYMTLKVGTSMSNLISYIIIGTFFIAGCIILYCKRNEIREFKQKNVTDKKMYLYVFTSLWMIIFLILHTTVAVSGIKKLGI